MKNIIKKKEKIFSSFREVFFTIFGRSFAGKDG